MKIYAKSTSKFWKKIYYPFPITNIKIFVIPIDKYNCMCYNNSVRRDDG